MKNFYSSSQSNPSTSDSSNRFQSSSQRTRCKYFKNLHKPGRCHRQELDEVKKDIESLKTAKSQLVVHDSEVSSDYSDSLARSATSDASG